MPNTVYGWRGPMSRYTCLLDRVGQLESISYVLANSTLIVLITYILLLLIVSDVTVTPCCLYGIYSGFMSVVLKWTLPAKCLEKLLET